MSLVLELVLARAHERYRYEVPIVRPRMVISSAPGKCILFGEHAVVYGQPAVAVAIDARIRVIIEESESGWLIDGMQFEKHRHPHLDAILKRVWVGSGGRPLSVKIESDLFGAAGLGSSAAICSAVAAGLLHIGGTKADELPLSGIATTAHLAEAEAQGGFRRGRERARRFWTLRELFGLCRRSDGRQGEVAGDGAGLRPRHPRRSRLLERREGKNR